MPVSVLPHPMTRLRARTPGRPDSEAPGRVGTVPLLAAGSVAGVAAPGPWPVFGRADHAWAASPVPPCELRLRNSLERPSPALREGRITTRTRELQGSEPTRP
jgi:hypothetical protein